MSAALALVEAPPVAVVRSDWSLREINTLELLIAPDDDSADEKRWQQAALVAALSASGMSLRKIAARWIKRRTGKTYDYTHVRWVLKVWSALHTALPRPNFLREYYRVSNRSKFCFGNGDDEWYTRESIIDAARTVLGTIDLDPASCAAANAVVKATRFFTIEGNGLVQPWSGTVWMNPPYSTEKIGPFCEKLVRHVQAGDVTAAIALVRSDTCARWFAVLSSAAAAVCFPSGRLRFWKPGVKTVGQSNLGTAIFYFGPDPQTFQREFQFGPVCFMAPPSEASR